MRDFKVKEALPKDVGRAIARIDPDDMKALGLEVGQVIGIEGKRQTVAKVMPCYVDDRGKGTIQMDGITRENAKIGIDEKVTVQAVPSQSARKITLSPLTATGRLEKDKDSKYVGSLIEGLPVLSGDKVRACLFGRKTCDFLVEDASPEGVVLITASTTINIKTKGTKVERARVSYEDIGGLGPQIQRIREMIELPLKYPEVFERLGIDAPKGVLMYGPPGTGKTLTARAVAHETDAYFTSISGPEVMGKFYGESEARLRSVFETAQSHAPAIIFIDEIDAIAPKREDMGGEKQVERRVVAQLLSLLDGLEARGHVIVIGATNIPNTLDPALRRPGRFDREISIPIPDRNGRLQILEVHTRGMPLAGDVSLDKLADVTHGFVGADLEALAREAAMSALRRIMPKIDFEMSDIPYETLLKLEITMDNFLEAMKEIEPSAIREVFVEVPCVKWSDVGGLDDIKQELREAVEWPLKYPQVFEQAGTHPAERHSAPRQTRHGQDAAGQGGGHRKRRELYLHQRPAACQPLRGRVGTRRPRDLPQGQAGGAGHPVLRRDRESHSPAGIERRWPGDGKGDQPIPDGDGRDRRAQRRRGPGGHQPAGPDRPSHAPQRPVRPPVRAADAGREHAGTDLRDPHEKQAAGPGRQSQALGPTDGGGHGLGHRGRVPQGRDARRPGAHP